MHSLDFLATVAVGYPTYNKDIPNHSIFEWLRAAINTASTLYAFDYGGSSEAKRSLERTKIICKGLENIPISIAILKARRDSTVLRTFVRLIFGMRACFAESFAICAGLRCLGFFDSYVVVGYSRIELFTPTNLHAWVEFRGEPVSDIAEVKYSYIELKRYS
jgi:Transglutaminase-like superfamily